MKRFVIFISSGIIILVLVFIYAQAKKDHTVIVDLSKEASQTKGKVLGAEAKISKKVNKVTTPINLKIDKNPVNLYWPQKINIVTTPNTEVRVKVTYANGNINNSGTKNGLSDDQGKFTISWTVKGNKDLLGRAQVNVSVGSLDTYAETNSNFEIVEYKKSITPLPASISTPQLNIPESTIQPQINLPNSP